MPWWVRRKDVRKNKKWQHCEELNFVWENLNWVVWNNVPVLNEMVKVCVPLKAVTLQKITFTTAHLFLRWWASAGQANPRKTFSAVMERVRNTWVSAHWATKVCFFWWTSECLAYWEWDLWTSLFGFINGNAYLLIMLLRGLVYCVKHSSKICFALTLLLKFQHPLCNLSQLIVPCQICAQVTSERSCHLKDASFSCNWISFKEKAVFVSLHF